MLQKRYNYGNLGHPGRVKSNTWRGFKSHVNFLSSFWPNFPPLFGFIRTSKGFASDMFWLAFAEGGRIMKEWLECFNEFCNRGLCVFTTTFGDNRILLLLLFWLLVLSISLLFWKLFNMLSFKVACSCIWGLFEERLSLDFIKLWERIDFNKKEDI